ncbi:MAG: hypothetical protein NZ699_01330 [Roseiflexus sp.]|nr:hypothetical protein [Roseiflexus sp.]MCS7287753.1 hypothetical protein [Roseiflexus sp.]MDW8147569.1 hypothetical protein [Roseiflexaceae bacterium]MDW8233174.1 hypothetical protein [Roseiflexaceae bacterium]
MGMPIDIDLDALDVSELERLRDAINRRILRKRRTKGLTLPELLRLFEETKAVLAEHHREWRSLERWQWMDGEIKFWLNPVDQESYRAGWYSIDDLIAWVYNEGPIVIRREEDEDDELDDEWNARDNRDNVTIHWLPDSETHTMSR